MSNKILDFFSFRKAGAGKIELQAEAKAEAQPLHCFCGESSVMGISRLELNSGEQFVVGYCEHCLEGLRIFHTTRKLAYHEKIKSVTNQAA